MNEWKADTVRFATMAVGAGTGLTLSDWASVVSILAASASLVYAVLCIWKKVRDWKVRHHD